LIALSELPGLTSVSEHDPQVNLNSYFATAGRGLRARRNPMQCPREASPGGSATERRLKRNLRARVPPVNHYSSSAIAGRGPHSFQAKFYPKRGKVAYEGSNEASPGGQSQTWSHEFRGEQCFTWEMRF
jgi:hypothetical protein